MAGMCMVAGWNSHAWIHQGVGRLVQPPWGPWCNPIIPKWVGPRRAQVGGPTPGPSQAQVGGPKLGPSQKFGTPKKKMKLLKIKIRSAQNVSKVFISRKKTPGPIWGPPRQFFVWAGKIQKMQKKCQKISCARPQTGWAENCWLRSLDRGSFAEDSWQRQPEKAA